MNAHTRKGITQHRYRCSRYAQHASKGCTPHLITLETLSDVVLTDIRQNARLAKTDEDLFVKALYQLTRKEQAAEVQRLTKEISSANSRLEEIDELAMIAAEKNLKGDIKFPDSVINMMFAKFDKEKLELQAKLPILIDALELANSQMEDVGAEIDTLKQHTEITELTREVVTSLIRVIYIGEPKQNGNEREYDIEIRYKFQPPQTIVKENTVSPNTVSPRNDILSTLTAN